VAAHLPGLGISEVEELWLVTVDPGLRPIGRHLIARGGPSGCAADPAVVLRHVLLDGAEGAFLAHNHPSGDATPSRQDRRFTARVRSQLDLLGRALHDHVVVAGDAVRSCAD
jgi:DNA repair protein RadC